MRRFMVRNVVAILVALTWGLNWVWAADSPPKARYPALAYVAAVLIILIVVAIVAFPSRKETWDQRVEKRRGRNP
jgi:hypothetical protein